MTTTWRTGCVSISGVIGPYPGQVNGEFLWNGFYCPRFTRDVAEQVVKDSTGERGDFGKWSWDGETLVVVAKGEYWGEGDTEEEWTTSYTPDADGMYHIGSWEWTWDEFDETPVTLVRSA